MGRALPGTNNQRLQEFLTHSPWDFRAMDRIRIEQMRKHASTDGGVLVVDDTGLPKKGRHSAGVGRQYSGTLGRVDNCQVVVTTHYADGVFDWPLGARLYLPKAWAADAKRRERARVPDDLVFRTKGEIALGLIDEVREAGLERTPVVADAGYGDQPGLLDGLEARELPCLVALAGRVRLRLAVEVDQDPGDGPPPPSTRGRPRKAPTLADRVQPRECAEILAALPDHAWAKVAWREGTKGALVKEVARVRVYRTAGRGRHLATVGWLIEERPLERFYQDAKGELGMDDYEARLWTGLHRHLALVMLAHSFLTLLQSYGSQVRERPPRTQRTNNAPAPPLARGFPPGGTEKYRRSSPNRP